MIRRVGGVTQNFAKPQLLVEDAGARYRLGAYNYAYSPYPPPALASERGIQQIKQISSLEIGSLSSRICSPD